MQILYRYDKRGNLMKVVIFSGGSGSQQLQRGLDFFNKDVDAMDITVITNCYDNGLSTGEVRKVFDGNILGPSDLRKNQILQYSLKEDHNKDLLSFLNLRIDEDNFEDAAQKIIDAHLQLADKVSDDIFDRLAWALNYFMAAPKAKDISYMNFSVSNAIYAAFANYHSNRMSEAGREMADILGLPKDSVVLNSDESLYLKAVTESGFVIGDEADIVDWNNEEDKIIDTFTENVKGEVVAPTLSDEAAAKIAEADLIILSSGTQWSSLIPTYKSLGFAEAMEKTKAPIVMVMNKSQDGDMKGRDANYIYDEVSKYFNTTLGVIITEDRLADSTMTGISYTVPKVYYNQEGSYDAKKHNPENLVTTILSAFYEWPSRYNNKSVSPYNYLILDYDDTLSPRNKDDFSYFEKSKKYLAREKLIHIVSGNDFNSIDPRLDEIDSIKTIYADNALNKYVKGKLVGDVLEISQEDIADMIGELMAANYDPSMIYNRGNKSIAIKPIPIQRDFVVNDIKKYVTMHGEFLVKESGTTTVEIVHKDSSKLHAINDILDNSDNARFTYVGDEPMGNDKEIFELRNSRISAIAVKNVRETLLFLKWRDIHFSSY